MARHPKAGIDYYPFDVDFFSDEKISAISGEFGTKGEIIVVKLLCAIYRNGYFIVWDEPLKMRLLGTLPGISVELLDKVVNRLVKWGFFEQALFNLERVLTSRGIQTRYLRITRRRKGMEDWPHLLVNVNKNAINVCRNGVNVDINRQRKDKQSLSCSFKENKNNSIINSAPDRENEERLIEELKKSDIWQEDMQRRFGISQEELFDRINEFSGECRCSGEDDHGTLQKIKYHFFHWLKKRKQTGNETQRKDRFSERRGTDPSANRAEDYTSTL